MSILSEVEKTYAVTKPGDVVWVEEPEDCGTCPQQDTCLTALLDRFAVIENMVRYVHENVKLVREVCRETAGAAEIWTQEVSGSVISPYETWIKHPEFNRGRPFAVATANDACVAYRNQYDWAKTFKKEPLPEKLEHAWNIAGMEMPAWMKKDAVYPRTLVKTPVATRAFDLLSFC